MSRKFSRSKRSFLRVIVLPSVLFSSVAPAENRPELALHSLEEVLVLGEKTGRSLIDTVNSITVLSADDLKIRGVADLRESFRRTAGVLNSGNNQGLSIRGIESDGIGGGGSSYTSTSNIIVDGVVQDRFSQRINPFDSWDMAQVEIFLGGQSQNMGKNSVAGAIVLETANPELNTNAAAIEGRVGANNLWGTMLMGNLGLTDTTALRLAAGKTEDDGTIDNPFLGIDADPSANEFLRAKLLWQPTDTFRSITMLTDDEAETGDDFVTRENRYDREIFSGSPAEENNDRFAASQRFFWTLSDQWGLDVIATYQDAEYFRTDDLDRTPSPGGVITQQQDTDESTLELRLNYNSDSLTALLGLYGATLETQSSTTIESLDLSTVSSAFPPGALLLSSFTTLDATVDNIALFAEVDFKLSERWSMRLAGRWDTQDEELEQTQESNLAFVFPTAEDADGTDYSEFLPFASLTYQINDRSNISLFYKEAYRSGGVEIRLDSGLTNTFDPEFSKTYEVAYRAAFDQLLLTANLYYSDWEDMQIGRATSDTMLITVTDNAAEASQYGLEAALDWTPSSSTRIYTTVALLDTELGKYDPLPEELGNFNGNAFRQAPELAASIGITYSFWSAWSFDVNLNYQDDAFNDVANTVTNDNFTLLNATLSFSARKWYAALTGTNLTDEDYTVNNCSAPCQRVQIGDPLLWQAKIGYRF
ncbi:MAG: TonB-dependent receptor [Pseudomonadota bacterium]